MTLVRFPVSRRRSLLPCVPSACEDLHRRIGQTLGKDVDPGRRMAKFHNKQTAYCLAQGAEELCALPEDLRARDGAAIEAARRHVEDARVSAQERRGL